MTDELAELKRKVAELEARQQGVTAPAPSKSNPGGVRAIMGLIVAILVVIVCIAAFRNVSMTAPGARVSTASDVVAYQENARETSSGSVNKAVIAELRPQVSNCKKIMTKNKATGTIGEVREIWGGAYDVEFNESVWNGLTHNDKVKAALLVFCSLMPNDGKATVIVQGLHTHDQLSRVVNGHYFSAK